mgnify:CR=1 FL=1
MVKENIDVPLAERARRANEIAARYGKTKTLLVSIHCNASGTGKGTGWEIHTSPGKTKLMIWRKFSGIWLIECLEELGKLEVIGRMGMGDWENNFYILQKDFMPGCFNGKLLYG